LQITRLKSSRLLRRILIWRTTISRSRVSRLSPHSRIHLLVRTHTFGPLRQPLISPDFRLSRRGRRFLRFRTRLCLMRPTLRSLRLSPVLLTHHAVLTRRRVHPAPALPRSSTPTRRRLSRCGGRTVGGHGSQRHRYSNAGPAMPAGGRSC